MTRAILERPSEGFGVPGSRDISLDRPEPVKREKATFEIEPKGEIDSNLRRGVKKLLDKFGYVDLGKVILSQDRIITLDRGDARPPIKVIPKGGFIKVEVVNGRELIEGTLALTKVGGISITNFMERAAEALDSLEKPDDEVNPEDAWSDEPTKGNVVINVVNRRQPIATTPAPSEVAVRASLSEAYDNKPSSLPSESEVKINVIKPQEKQPEEGNPSGRTRVQAIKEWLALLPPERLKEVRWFRKRRVEGEEKRES